MHRIEDADERELEPSDFVVKAEAVGAHQSDAVNLGARDDKEQHDPRRSFVQEAQHIHRDIRA
jgi:hypothetical protein